MTRKAAKTEILEEQKKRAVHLKIQGWSSKDVANDTGILFNTIDAHWREWAVQFGIELPAKPDRPRQTGSSSEVTSYRIDPETGERLTEPVTEVVELSTESMPSDGGVPMREAIEQEVRRQERKNAVGAGFKLVAELEPEPVRPGPSIELPEVTGVCGLLDSLNRLLWGYIVSNQLPQSECYYKVEMAEGILLVRIALPAGEEGQHGQHGQ